MYTYIYVTLPNYLEKLIFLSFKNVFILNFLFSTVIKRKKRSIYMSVYDFFRFEVRESTYTCGVYEDAKV